MDLLALRLASSIFLELDLPKKIFVSRESQFLASWPAVMVFKEQAKTFIAEVSSAIPAVATSFGYGSHLNKASNIFKEKNAES